MLILLYMHAYFTGWLETQVDELKHKVAKQNTLRAQKQPEVDKALKKTLIMMMLKVKRVK